MSRLIVAAGADRSLCVVDVGAGRVARALPDAHARAAHAVALAQPSNYASHPAGDAAYDVFLTSCAGGGSDGGGCVALWDVRAGPACVRRLTGHANRVHRVGCALSPCLRYAAGGGEGRAGGCVWDTRTGACVARLRGHRDTVADVAFSPAHPQLATVGFDGHVKFFTEDGRDDY